MKKINILSSLIILIGMSSCNYSRLKNQPGSDSGLSSDTPISYDIVKSYSLSSCLKCHSGTQAPALNSLQNLISNQVLIKNEINDGAMPPKSSGYELLSQCQIDLYSKWVELGSPETSTHLVAEIPSCSSEFSAQPQIIPILLMPLNYQTLRTKILQPKCLLCHTSDGEANYLPYFPYGELVLTGNWSAPAKSSKVMEEITASDGMPPTDSGVTPLSTDEIEFIKRWIDAGKPEN